MKSYSPFVGIAGFEPAIFSSQMRRSAKLSHIPLNDKSLLSFRRYCHGAQELNPTLRSMENSELPKLENSKHSKFSRSSSGGIRTHTVPVLSRFSLPLEYRAIFINIWQFHQLFINSFCQIVPPVGFEPTILWLRVRCFEPAKLQRQIFHYLFFNNLTITYC